MHGKCAFRSLFARKKWTNIFKKIKNFDSYKALIIQMEHFLVWILVLTQSNQITIKIFWFIAKSPNKLSKQKRWTSCSRFKSRKFIQSKYIRNERIMVMYCVFLSVSFITADTYVTSIYSLEWKTVFFFDFHTWHKCVLEIFHFSHNMRRLHFVKKGSETVDRTKVSKMDVQCWTEGVRLMYTFRHYNTK